MTSAARSQTDRPGRRAVVIVLAACLLAACTSLRGPRTVEVSAGELSRRLAEQFPLERRWLDLIDVQMSSPRLRTDAPSQRVHTAFDLRLGDRLFGRRFTARLAMSARLHLELSDHSIRLREVALEDFSADGADDAWLARAGRLPAWIVSQSLENVPVYRLGADQIDRLAREGLHVRDLRVTNDGLAFTVAPRT